MKLKYKILIAVIFLAIFETLAILYGYKYSYKSINGGNSAEVLEVYDTYIIASCNNSYCYDHGDRVNIKIEKPSDIKVDKKETIYFKVDENKNFQFLTSHKENNRYYSYTSFLIGTPILIVFVYFFFGMMFSKEEHKLYKYLPITSALSAFFGMFLFSITEIDLIQGIGFLLIIFSLLSPFVFKKYIIPYYDKKHIIEKNIQ